MAYIISRRSTLIALLISLLLHVTTMLYLTLQHTNIKTNLLQEKDELLDLLPKKTKEDPAWVTTKARNSSFGAAVLFRDEPDKKIAPHIFSQNQSTQSENSQEAKEQPECESVEKNLDIKQETTHIKTITPQQETVQKSTRTAPSFSSTITTQKITPMSAPSQPLTMHKKPPLTLAQLTQGVLNYAKEEGQHAVSMIGAKNGAACEEQMKYERYLQKLQWCIQNSFTINKNRFPLCDPDSFNISVFLSLNRDGTLHNLRLAKTSKDPRIDAFVMFVFRDASTGFPPVPHYLPNDPFSITFIYTISPLPKNIRTQPHS